MKRETELPSSIARAVDDLAATTGVSVDGIVARALTLYLNFLSAPDETVAELMQVRARPQPLETVRALTTLFKKRRIGRL